MLLVAPSILLASRKRSRAFAEHCLKKVALLQSGAPFAGDLDSRQWWTSLLPFCRIVRRAVIEVPPLDIAVTVAGSTGVVRVTVTAASLGNA